MPRSRDSALIIDAIVLAGGRSSRLGEPKQAVRLGESTLLDLALRAASGARRRVVVGEAGGELPAGVELVREHPRFGGPAAAVAAGLAALPADSDLTLVLACDMPRAAEAVAAMVVAADARGAVAVDRGRAQPLLALYPTADLRAAVARVGEVDGLAMRELVGGLEVPPFAVTDGAATDIDTPADAAAFGITNLEARMPAADPIETLREWAARFIVELEAAGLSVGDLRLDVDQVLALAGAVAHGVVRPAAPVSTFLVGYAAGRAAAAGADPRAAVTRATALATAFAGTP